MTSSNLNITLCSVAVAISVLIWNCTSTAAAPPTNPLCDIAVGVRGGLHGTVIEPCELPSSETFRSTPATTASEPPPASPQPDLTIAVASLFAHRILMGDTLISMIP